MGGRSSSEKVKETETEKELARVTYADYQFYKEFYQPVEGALLGRIDALRSPAERERTMAGQAVDTLAAGVGGVSLSQQARDLYAHELGSAGNLGLATSSSVGQLVERGARGAVEGIALGRDLAHQTSQALARSASADAYSERARAQASSTRRTALRSALGELAGFGYRQWEEGQESKKEE